MTPDYIEFLARKAPRAQSVGIEPTAMPAHMFDYQAHATAFALRLGRAAIFHDTGLGKTIDELEWCRQAAQATNGRAIIMTPLAVAKQIEREGHKFGYDVRIIREQSDVRDGISICNYDRLDRLDMAAFGAVALDESDILKDFNGATSRALMQACAGHRFKLGATATPAPNDHMELGQHAEFLEIMASNEMLARWFVSDQTDMGKYRLKRYGEHAFWDWMVSWASMAESPADLGFDASAFVLPELRIIRHQTHGNIKPPVGSLFHENVSATNMFDIKRQTSEARALAAGMLVAAEPALPWVVWVDTNDEADAVMKHLPDAQEVRGSHPMERKEEVLEAFAAGEFGQLVTKPRIAGRGLNWQHANRMAYVGRSFSYQAWYQSVRRCWRFGQKRPVDVHLIVAEGEDQIGRVIDRKADDHATMKRAMSAAMTRDRVKSSQVKVAYDPQHLGRIPSWLTSSVA